MKSDIKGHGSENEPCLSLLKKYIIEKSCTKLKFTSTLFKGWWVSRGQSPWSHSAECETP